MAGGESPRRDRVRRRLRGRTLAAGVGLALLAAAGPAGAQRAAGGPSGARAYDAAQSAASAAETAAEEGAQLLVQLRAQLGPGPHSGARQDVAREAAAAERALAGYRRLARASADEAVRLLAESPRGGEGPDRGRRLVAEDRALLAGREAEVMAGRARTEAERIRALLAEARLLVATEGSGRPGRGAASPGDAVGPPGASAAGSAPAAGAGVVPNVVGARLEAARRDLEDAGLRLGAVTGSREGFVIRQSPEAGLELARGAAVAVVLSDSAASAQDPSP